MGVMERRGGCGAARYGCDADVAWKLGRILLSYRPIAPKPAAADAAVPGAASDAGGGASGIGRGKRKGGGRREGKRGRKTRRVALAGVFQEEEKEKEKEKEEGGTTPLSSSTTAVTLPLMPETPERKEECAEVPSPTSSDQTAPCSQAAWRQRRGAAVLAPPSGSSVTVELVTGAWQEEEVGGCCSDEAVRRLLEGDASPGFVSDSCDRVTWTNAAYPRMVVGGGPEGGEAVRVALATRGMVPAGGACRAFTCGVTVRYASRRMGRVTMAAPCDVWRLGDGGLAWRLDMKAALSLSLDR